MRLFLACLLILFVDPAQAIQIVTGTYTGDGSDNRDITISPACQPKAVFVGRAPKSGSGFGFRTDSMSGDKTASMNSSVALQADLVQAINANGFQVGTARNTNTANFAYAALCDNSNSDLATGTYTGDGTDNRDIIISPAFQPEFVYVVPDASATAVFRTSTHSGDTMSAFNSASSNAANYIQSFGASGFQVGTSMNVNTTVYHYLAVKASSSGVSSGSFSGNATDNRDITVGFQPAIIFLKGNSANEEGAIRLASHSGDDSFCDTSVATTDVIQAFGSTTFQVGTDACANENAITMFWAALASVSPASSFGPLRRRHQ